MFLKNAKSLCNGCRYRLCKEKQENAHIQGREKKTMASANVGDLGDKYNSRLSEEDKQRMIENRTNLKTRNFLKALLYGTHFVDLEEN